MYQYAKLRPYYNMISVAILSLEIGILYR